ncbi:MAG TPA: tRNA (N6-isopentenyl adenosine(37)-C2)-methylthiotransferase MiaB, partial [Erysipelothrix sp.]|nr:tRNA (N6-isopentenyl adenosine(37)-C2)-methylthiotransferase MiaB [Erysipelothrix sp.]
MRKDWIKPSLSEARRRTKEEVSFEYTLFSVDEDLKQLGVGKKYYIRTYGCQANERDGEHIAGILKEMNFQPTDQIEEADVILFNTCSIRENANNKVFGDLGNIKHLKRENPDIIIGLSGCMAQEEVVISKVLESYHQVDLIFGTHNIYRLPQLLAQAILSKERTIEVYSHQGEIIENLPSSRALSHKAWVNIIFGCDKFCTYCIVPYTRGKERSRKLEDIL